MIVNKLTSNNKLPEVEHAYFCYPNGIGTVSDGFWMCLSYCVCKKYLLFFMYMYSLSLYRLNIEIFIHSFFPPCMFFLFLFFVIDIPHTGMRMLSVLLKGILLGMPFSLEALWYAVHTCWTEMPIDSRIDMRIVKLTLLFIKCSFCYHCHQCHLHNMPQSLLSQQHKIKSVGVNWLFSLSSALSFTAANSIVIEWSFGSNKRIKNNIQFVSHFYSMHCFLMIEHKFKSKVFMHFSF